MLKGVLLSTGLVDQCHYSNVQFFQFCILSQQSLMCETYAVPVFRVTIEIITFLMYVHFNLVVYIM